MSYMKYRNSIFFPLLVVNLLLSFSNHSPLFINLLLQNLNRTPVLDQGFLDYSLPDLLPQRLQQLRQQQGLDEEQEAETTWLNMLKLKPQNLQFPVLFQINSYSWFLNMQKLLQEPSFK